MRTLTRRTLTIKSPPPTPRNAAAAAPAQPSRSCDGAVASHAARPTACPSSVAVSVYDAAAGPSSNSSYCALPLLLLLLLLPTCASVCCCRLAPHTCVASHRQADNTAL